MNCEVKGCNEKATGFVTLASREWRFLVIPYYKMKSFDLCDSHRHDIQETILHFVLEGS